MTLMLLALLFIYQLNPFNFGYLAGYLLIGLIIIQGPFMAKNMDLDFVLLILYSFSYAMFYSFDYESRGAQYIAIFATTPPFFYLLGKYLVKDRPGAHLLFYLLFALSLMYSCSAMISVFQNFLTGGFVQLERSIPYFWGGEPVSATLMGAYFTLNMCIPALLILSRARKGLLFNTLAIATFIVSLICVLRLGSRTQLSIFLLTTLLALFYVVPKLSIKQNTLLLALIGGIVFYIATTIDFSMDADWLTTFAGRMEANGNVSTGGGRTDIWLKSLELIFTYPFGWEAEKYGFAHNLWLDVVRAVGIVPFIILIIYSIRSFNQVRKTIRMNQDAIAFNGQVLVYGLAFFLQFMVEPVMEGIFGSFVLFCLYKGVINKYRSNNQI